MPYCTRCGKEIPETGDFCPWCGTRREPAGLPPAPAPTVGVGEEDLAAYVGEKATVYLPRFRQFHVGGVDDFSVTWHWPCLFVPLWWMLYRKLYLWALAVFASSWIPFSNFGWAMAANYIYYKAARQRILQVRAVHPQGDLSPVLAQLGGVNGWVWPLAIVVSLIFFLLMALYFGFIIAAILAGGAGRHGI